MAESEDSKRRPPRSVVRYAPLEELKVYEISEAELEKFENGPPGQEHLSFALALLPVALTILITVQTVDIQVNRTYYLYWIAFWLLLIQGLVSLVRWWKIGGSMKSLGQEIRSRMPEKPGIAEQITTAHSELATD